MTEKHRTLAVHLEAFSKKELLVMMWALNESNVLGYQVHQGILPFVSVDDALKALAQYGSTRVAATAREKLKTSFGAGEWISWIMYLNGKKVARRFGAHPERGQRIPYVQPKKVTVGVRWSLPKKDYEPDDDVLVQPHVVLQCMNKAQWKVTCEKKYKSHVELFLIDNCM